MPAMSLHGIRAPSRSVSGLTALTASPISRSRMATASMTISTLIGPCLRCERIEVMAEAMSSSRSASERLTVAAGPSRHGSARAPSDRCGAPGRRAHRGVLQFVLDADDVDDVGPGGSRQAGRRRCPRDRRRVRRCRRSRVRDAVTAQHLEQLATAGGHTPAGGAAERLSGRRCGLGHVSIVSAALRLSPIYSPGPWSDCCWAGRGTGPSRGLVGALLPGVARSLIRQASAAVG